MSCERDCCFSDENVLSLSKKLDSHDAIVRIAIQLGLDLIAIKTLEEHFLCCNKFHMIAYLSFSAFIDTRGECSDNDIYENMIKRISVHEKDTDIKKFLSDFKYMFKDKVTASKHNHTFRTKSFCKWELYESRFAITNEFILCLADMFKSESPKSILAELEIATYFNVINDRYPCKKGKHDKYEWRKKLESLFKGRERWGNQKWGDVKIEDNQWSKYELDDDAPAFYEQLKQMRPDLPHFKNQKVDKSDKYLRVFEISKLYKEQYKWEAQIKDRENV